MRSSIVCLFSLMLFTAMSQSTPIYAVKYIPLHSFQINGLGDNPVWNQADILTDFMYPWDEGSPPAMSFQALHDRDYIYGLYRVTDPKKILIYRKTDHKREVLSSDRVEIFLRKDVNMDPYYALELDPLGRIYDNQARYHRKFDQTWTWPAGQLDVKAAINDQGYTLEFAISKKSLTDMGLLKQNIIEAGLYRGECIQLDGDKAEFKWISWVRPESETPDFHVPSSFGLLQLQH